MQEDSQQNPEVVYAARTGELNAQQQKDKRRERAAALAKLSMAVVAVVLAVLLLHSPHLLILVALPIAAFIVFAVLQDKLLRSIRLRARVLTYYERGQARLQGTWPGKSQTGEQFAEPLHPYARDLDLFGRASLFEMLCTARTRAGEQTLAAWLKAPAAVAEIELRQAAVRELSGRLLLREQLWSRGDTVRRSVSPEELAGWGEQQTSPVTSKLRFLTAALAILWLVSLACWVALGSSLFFLAVTLANWFYASRLRARLDEAAGAVEYAAKDLGLLASVLELLEREKFESPKLLALRGALATSGARPSEASRKLAGLVAYLESGRNPIARMLDLVTFWRVQVLWPVAQWQRQFGPAIRGWLAAVGEFEALAAFAAFAYEHPDYVFPSFVDEGPLFSASEFAHPLLPALAATNDLTLGETARLLLISGPNMAGKSTFIRAVGVNAVLAQCGAPVRARSMRLSPLAVGASISIFDSLEGGASRFYSEIRRLKLIADLTKGSLPVLFLMDELLSGTNSYDRLTGTEFIVRDLVDKGAVGMVSTHDLALTAIPDRLGSRGVNCHFEDQLGDGALIFDYKLKPGVVQTSNALELMRSIGLGVPRSRAAGDDRETNSSDDFG